ncbi:YbaB/EbfC family nucleoid-associated protein [Aestuariivirga litoralis]|uniref:YbaB/EbfC family nucleoid-associated protein n=1 Tax=Aestuariivirga litoralis TaxID=2650924 RepID=UPI0018C80BC0|nr:YbaB/EbfC family nucleoid-associated protein [Aestuariivirga litoralis]MBG1232771.1 YbaB/EbfC family nucleoid-associated protein [Aestuariivirga litoralis]
MKNLADIMKSAGQMQAKMADMQAKLEQLVVEGQSGGGLVKVKMSGKFSVTAVEIDPSLLKDGEKEILEDLLMAALADAKGKAETMAAEQMQSLTAGLPLPPGFKLPF